MGLSDVLAFALVASLVVFGALLEGRRWSRPVELARWVLFAAGLVVAST